MTSTTGSTEVPERNLKALIAYDGTAYVGWERQNNGLGIQEVPGAQGAFALCKLAKQTRSWTYRVTVVRVSGEKHGSNKFTWHGLHKW